MQRILSSGRLASNGIHYVHPGDLAWWLFYPPVGANPFGRIYLWEDIQNPTSLLGWTLLSPEAEAFDVYLRPDVVGTGIGEAIFRWSETHLDELARQRGGDEICNVWISSKGEWLPAILKSHGFMPNGELMDHMQRSLEHGIPAVTLPDGYLLRSCFGLQECDNRAAAQYAAFLSKIPFEAYCQRFENFMRSPVYAPDNDIVIQAPGGQVASFCLIWLDPHSRTGLFEPVGTHPEHQGKGLGKALLVEGLRRMQVAGMTNAIVNTEHTNLAARRLYEAVGFTTIDLLETFVRKVVP
jgi:ribosomal protein S18 acetylase RimI-like enzyme